MAFPQFYNFTAASRKNNLIPMGIFNPMDSVSWIFNAQGNPPSPIGLLGTVDGTNAAFTLPSPYTVISAIMRNGVIQDPATMYSVSGITVTFQTNFIPQTGDDIQGLLT